MSIVVEVTSIVIRTSILDDKYPGGSKAYYADCRDEYLTRISFMNPLDVRCHLDHLTKNSLLVSTGDSFVDVAVVDQFGGLLQPCEWLEFARHDDGYSYCWLSGTDPGVLCVPPDWTPEQSQSYFRVK